MQIDWFTFVAQVLNFLILVWLLKKFLYAPILGAIEQRERGIAERLEQAADREAAAQTVKQSYEQQMTELAHIKESLLLEAAADVEQWRQERLETLREEVEQARRNWHDAIDRERSQFLGQLKERTATQVQEVARHVLEELADGNLEQQVVQRFLKELESKPEEETAVLNSKQPGSPVVIRTAFPLAEEQSTRLSHQIGKQVDARPVQFEVDPLLV